jgi:hypothetical protein
MRKGWEIGVWLRIGMIFGDLEFLGELQRRGAHVNSPEIGSRGGVFCCWGNLGFCADLRRECVRVN